jgi:Protein of unknown function (DUF1570)
MEPVVIERVDVGGTGRSGPGGGPCSGAPASISGRMLLVAVIGLAGPAVAQGPLARATPTDGKPAGRSILAGHTAEATGTAAKPSGSPTFAGVEPSHESRPAAAKALAANAPVTPAHEEAKRYRIRDKDGSCVVARLHGEYGGKTVLLQPDGQLGFPTRLVPTKEPFVPTAADELKRRLERGPYTGFAEITTEHYLVFYQSRLAFAQDSARLLEELYRGLTEFCRRHGLSVHESEFPLVAVIFAKEEDFRAHKPVDPEVQAYYEIFTNRIFFYEQSERDRNEPKLVALRKPQTVAHEGTHQILANIGVQPRLAAWPLWLVEGFTEYCATPTRTKKGLAWDKMGAINPLHMATLRELDDPLTSELLDDAQHAKAPAGPIRLFDAESLVKKTQLTPTDYAQAWALTHYLALQRAPEFVEFLKSMSRMPPLETRMPESHLATFHKFFGDDLAKLDRKAEAYIRKKSQQGNFVALPHYAVIFEQPLGGGMVRRRATVSQSPQVIQRWVEQSIVPQGGVPNWQVWPFPSRARAVMAAEEWMSRQY